MNRRDIVKACNNFIEENIEEIYIMVNKYISREDWNVSEDTTAELVLLEVLAKKEEYTLE